MPQAHAALVAGPLGAQPLGGRRARRQDARHRRARPHRQARRRPGQGRSGCAWSRTTRSCRTTGPRRWVSSCWRSTRSWPSPTSSRSTCRRPPRPIGLINRDLLLKAKPSLRVINVARGGIVDEADLADCLRDGIIAGAALDVFSTEPMTESPLFEIDSVVVTPHLGASTREAQDKAGDTIADDGAARPRRRVRAVRGQRQRRRGQRDASGRTCRSPSGSAACSCRSSVRCPHELEICMRGRDRRLRHPHPRAGRAEGVLRGDLRRAGHLRQRAAARQAARRRGARRELARRRPTSSTC